jgi:predicted methyltransferase
LREAYFESACHYPEIYDGFTFEQWLEFLEDARLVTRTGKHVLLTSKGRDFLHYRITAEAAIATSPPGCRCIT